jgi:hypothetical protein
VRALAIAALGLALGACHTPPYDYGAYLAHMPRSILVLPPLDETPEVGACYGWLSTITRPLAERGYYVFPVALVDRILKENGLPTPGEMHTVSRGKLREVFGADAVLYVTVTEWGTSYAVLASVTSVRVRARLVDLATGTELWSGEGYARRSSNDHNQGGLLGALVGALVNQVMTSVLDPTLDIAREANGALATDSHHGLLRGPRHPEHEEELRVRREAQASLGH